MHNETDSLYFMCEWIITPLESRVIWDALGESGRLGFYMFVDDVSKTEKGIWVMRFVARVPSQDALDTFIQGIGADVGWTNWFPLPEGHRKIGPSFTASAMPDFCASIRRLGRVNEQLKRQHE